jgi:DNA helicase-2/ATP-dependent DNA helicase PcrA
MSSLNPRQQEAADFFQGAALIVAGAGSGKTRVLISRIKNLTINHGVPPYQIVALTFTNKAANEVKSRLAAIFSEGSKPFIGTFHGFCLQQLFRNSELFGLKGFSILDGSDQASLMKKILKKFCRENDCTPGKILGIISKAKNCVSLPVDAQISDSKILEIYHEYEKEKKKSSSLDFDDLINVVYQKLKTDVIYLEKVRRQASHILIDEYQDTNELQHDFIKKIATQNKELCIESIFAVGDEDQSIYSWRGAVVENMQRFVKDFSPVKTIKVEQNYRCVQPILETANALISNNKRINAKKLWSEKKANNRIFHAFCRSDLSEASLVVSAITQLQSDKAILYRTHSQSRVLEEALIRQQQPYVIVGGTKFYQRKEIKDLLAYLKLINNPQDRTSFTRAICCPSRGIGNKSLEQIFDFWDITPEQSFSATLSSMAAESESKRNDTLLEFTKIFQDLSAQNKASEALETIIKKTGYFAHLEKVCEEKELEERTKNIEELKKAMLLFEESCEESPTLEKFISEIALFQDDEKADKTSKDTVKMMSLHSAKGLEFDNVFIIGLEEGTLPSLRRDCGNEELEEERRLLYVGITRAKERLILSGASNKMEYGRVVAKDPSRFAKEILSNKVTTYDETKNKFGSAAKKLTLWLSGKTISEQDNFYAQMREQSSTFSSSRIQQVIEKNPFVKKRTTYESYTPNIWKKNQSVMHKVFGMGLVRYAKKITEYDYNVTVAFPRLGEKIIKSQFLSKI